MDLLVSIRILLLVLSLGTLLPVLNYGGTMKAILGQLSFLIPLYIPTFIFFGVSFFFTNYYLVILPAVVAFILQVMIIHSQLNAQGSTSALGYLIIPVLSAIAYLLVGGVILVFLWIKGIKI